MNKTYIALIAPKAVRNAEICSIADPLIANEDDWLPCNGMLFIGFMDINNFDPTNEANALTEMKKHAAALVLTVPENIRLIPVCENATLVHMLNRKE